MTEQLEARLRRLGSLSGGEPIHHDEGVHVALHDAADTLKRYREALLAYCEAYDAFTGTVYVNAQIRQALSDS